MAGKIISNLKRKRQEETECSSPIEGSNSSSNSSEQEPKRERIEELEADINKQSFLVEALNKIAELQRQLQENDVDLDDDEFGEYSDDDDSEVSLYLDEQKRHEAEAIGFAMCARETLLFLQKEGIPETSAIYKALKEKLVGKCDGIPI